MIARLFRDVWRSLTRKASLLWLVLAVPLLCLIATDSVTSDLWRFSKGTPAYHEACKISKRGDFYTGCAFLVVVLSICGWIFKSRRLQVLGAVMLLSCAVAGLSSLVLRVGSGRPRPSAQVADGLYGLKFKPHKTGVTFLDYDYQSFPSGHTVTAVATAVPTVMILPVVGAPLLVAAVAVAWARFELNRHHLSDIYMGFLWGGFLGFLFGKAGLRELRAAKIRK